MTTIPAFTLVTLIGPSESGKSTLARRLQEAYGPSVVAVVSSDALRRRLIAADLHKHDERMLEVSSAAFDLLFAELGAQMTYPVSRPIVVADTTGLNEAFRKRLRDMAKERGYHSYSILFDYKRAEDYTTDPKALPIVRRHLRKMRLDMAQIRSRAYHGTIRLRSKEEAAKLEIEIAGLGALGRRRLEGEPFVVGDVHGCYDELCALLEKAGYAVEAGSPARVAPREGHPIVLVGDIIDKGPKSREVIELLYENPHVRLVTGNHESWVYRYLKGELKGVDDQRHLFPTLGELERDPLLTEKFMNVMERAEPFLYGDGFIITHAPCHKEALGKTHTWAEQQAVQERYPRRRDYETDEAFSKAFHAHFSYLKTEAAANEPRHVFGHVAQDDVFMYANKIGVDTGCASGGRLSGVWLTRGRNPFIVSVPSLVKTREAMSPRLVPKRGPREATLDTLSDDERERLERLVKNRVNFISGTMCPGDKRTDGDEPVLESLEEALAYYRRKGAEAVVLQPKHMGSRANVYLFKDAEACYAVSRDGYVIRPDRADLRPLYAPLIERVFGTAGAPGPYADARMVLLDCELMPWSALGTGLIEHMFRAVETGLREEHAFMQATGFHEAYGALVEKTHTSGFAADWGQLTKADLIKKYGQAGYRSYYGALRYGRSYQTAEDTERALEAFSRQLAAHARPVRSEAHPDGEPLEIRPFSVLKVVYEDGRERVMTDATNEELYLQVSGSNVYRYVALNDACALETAQSFFDHICREGLEGVVVKPLRVHTPGVAPYLKVRNPDYLTIVYGPDYRTPNKYARLVEEKRVHTKLAVSVREWELGLEMLGVPYDGLDSDAFRAAAAAFIGEEKKEQHLDPRL